MNSQRGRVFTRLHLSLIFQLQTRFNYLNKAKGMETEQSVLKIFFQLLTQRSGLPCQYDTSPAQQLKKRFFCLGPSGLGLWILTLKMTESMFCPIKQMRNQSPTQDFPMTISIHSRLTRRYRSRSTNARIYGLKMITTRYTRTKKLRRPVKKEKNHHF